ncbi:MAG: hypothetical protein SGPRY_014265, partial [Prymnesium sp.]
EASELLRAKVDAFEEKQGALQARCKAAAAELSDAVARRDRLATEIRSLQAKRTEGESHSGAGSSTGAIPRAAGAHAAGSPPRKS